MVFIGRWAAGNIVLDLRSRWIVVELGRLGLGLRGGWIATPGRLAPISAVGGLLLRVSLLIVRLFATSASTCTAGGLLLSWVTLASVSAVGRLLS